MTKEYANAFTGVDPMDQLSRFEAQAKAKELGDDEAESASTMITLVL